MSPCTRAYLGKFSIPPDGPEWWGWQDRPKHVINHSFFSIPWEEPSFSEEKFSKTHIGSMAAYNALDFLISRSSQHNHLRNGNDSIMIERQWSKHTLLACKQEENLRFRAKHGIKETALVIFLHPGNRVWETNHILPTAIEALEKLVPYIHSSQRDCVVVIPQEENINGIEQEIPDLHAQIGTRILVTKNNEEKLSAMAASKLAIA